jgi:3-deoxy-manno-octulosonate cytidylyltransferase (CMP-KDO synthetase)
MAKNDAKIIIIPARIAASRLPRKPLADIGGKPMIQHVWERAIAADLAPVYVATDDRTISDVITAAGGKAVMTRSDHPSGSDRVFEAVEAIDPNGKIDQILNLQGDIPELQADMLYRLATTLAQSDADLATLVAQATNDEATRPQVVKAVVTWQNADFGRALYFSRAAVPTGMTPLWHHIGLYGWRRDALARFVSLPPSPLEQAEKLEQLRALEAGMTIAVGRVDKGPSGVDTPEDLNAVRQRIGSNSAKY